MGPQNWTLDPTPKTPLDPPPRNSLCTVFCWENQHLHKEFGRLSPLLDPRPGSVRNSLCRFSLGVFSVREGYFLFWRVSLVLTRNSEIKNNPKNLLRLFLPQKLFFFSEVIFKDPPKICFKTSIKITSRGYFYFSRLFFTSRGYF